MDLFVDTAADLNYVVSTSYYGTLGGKCLLKCAPLSIGKNRIQKGRRIAEKVDY